MRLLTAGSLVRAQQGEPEKSASGNRCAFSFAKRQRPCAFTAARADGVQQSKTERTNKRRGAAVNCAGAERARWAMQRGGGGPGNRAMCRGPVARGAARQFPGSEWSLVRAQQGEPEKSALGNRCAFSFAKRPTTLCVHSRKSWRGAAKQNRTHKQNGAGRLLTAPEPSAPGGRCSEAEAGPETERCAAGRWPVVHRDNFRARNGRWFEPGRGSQKKAHRVTGALFLLQSGNDPVRSQPQELTGCSKATPNAQTKRRGAAVPFAGAGQPKINQSNKRRTSQ